MDFIDRAGHHVLVNEQEISIFDGTKLKTLSLNLTYLYSVLLGTLKVRLL